MLAIFTLKKTFVSPIYAIVSWQLNILVNYKLVNTNLDNESDPTYSIELALTEGKRTLCVLQELCSFGTIESSRAHVRIMRMLACFLKIMS